MAIPNSPSVVVLENDVSIYTPNINSSVVGLVGFANKGPTNKATLVTSQENLVRLFGKPNSVIPGQGLEGALEILEATNQLYFVRAANASAQSASADIPMGACPAVALSGYTPSVDTSSLHVTVLDNAGTVKYDRVIQFASSTSFGTTSEIFLNTFSQDVESDAPVFAHIDGDELFLVSRYAGSGATLRVSGEANGISSIVLGKDGSGIGSYALDTTTSGLTAQTLTLRTLSKYPGDGYNLSSLRDGSTQGISVEINNLSTKDELVVNSDGAAAETFKPISLVPSASDFVEYILNSVEENNKSDYVYAEILNGGVDYTTPNVFGDKVASTTWAGHDAGTGTPRFVKPIEGTYAFAGGDSGYGAVEGAEAEDMPNDAAALIGDAAAKTGMYALDNDTLNISIGLIPGVTNDSVQNALVTLAETSKNFLALVGAPYGLATVQDSVDWINGKDASTRTAALNSSYAAAYWPWVQVFNYYAGQDEWYDPAIFAARQCVFTDAISEPWFAPAGFRRGRLTKPTATEILLNQGDRDALYSNSINPVINDPTTGVTIFGQRTTQRAATALDRINVRRLMIFIRKVLLELGKPFQFEPNDEFTWELVEESINPFLDDLLARRAIVEGAVKCDSTTNTPVRVDRNELWCSVTIKPTKAAETIVFEVNLTSQAATING
jgi:phage tail sheath protein FI